MCKKIMYFKVLVKAFSNKKCILKPCYDHMCDEMSRKQNCKSWIVHEMANIPRSNQSLNTSKSYKSDKKNNKCANTYPGLPEVGSCAMQE
jgi:hypothetical protein